MPQVQRGQFESYGKGPNRRWRVRYYDHGKRVRKSGFLTKSEAVEWFEKVERPRMLGLAGNGPEMTLAAYFADYVKLHVASEATKETIRNRMVRPLEQYGDVKLRDLQSMTHEMALWAATLGDYRYAVVSTMRQVFSAAVRHRKMDSNPAVEMGPNPRPKSEEFDPFTDDELETFLDEFEGVRRAMVGFGAETGLRPGELLALERSDVDRRKMVVLVERSIGHGGAIQPFTKTSDRRHVPLSDAALAFVDSLPPRLDTKVLFPARDGRPMDLDTFRRDYFAPAVESSGLISCCGDVMEKTSRKRKGRSVYRCSACQTERLARSPYSLRHTFATNALSAGWGIFELARYMGTGIDKIEETYGHLAKGNEDVARAKLNARRRTGAEEREAEAE